jgi:hypothetical protein
MISPKLPRTRLFGNTKGMLLNDWYPLTGSRFEKTFIPYKWNGTTINPQIPSQAVDSIFTSIKTELDEHPLPKFKKTILKYFLSFHLPVILIAAGFLVYFCTKKGKDDSFVLRYSLFFTGLVMFLTILLVSYSVVKTCSYNTLLKKREDDLNALLHTLNNTTMFPYQMVAISGKYGAWIELSFNNFDTGMVPVQVPQNNQSAQHQNPNNLCYIPPANGVGDQY